MFVPSLVSLCLGTNYKTLSSQKTDTLLRSYIGDNIGLLGECWVPVKYQDQECDKLPLLIAEGQRPSLLGRDWLYKVKLNWQEVFGISAIEVEVIRSEYSQFSSQTVNQ